MNRPLVILDLETTGTDISSDRIVQIACLKVSPDFEQIGDIKNYLVNPGIPIPKGASDVHGITDEMVKDEPLFAHYAKGLYAYLLGCDIVGFNSNRFDVPLLAEEFLRIHPEVVFPSPDTLLFDAYSIFSQKEKRDLTAAYKFYCNKDLEGAHDAKNDILATFEVFKSQLDFYKDLKEMDLNQLHNFCGGDIRVDLAGTIVLNENGTAVYNIGKDKGKSVVKNPSFGQWMLKTPSFCSSTKEVLRKLIK